MTSTMPEHRVEMHVCVVNWRTPQMTVDCLRSIALERERVLVRVVVVDNASGDGSAEQISAAVHENGWAEWVQVLAAERNGGFAYGNNLAIRAALGADSRAAFFMLLNPDTVVRPQAFRILLDFMHDHPDAGFAGASSEDPDGTRQPCCFRFPSPLGEFAGYARMGVVDRLLKRWRVLVGNPEKPTRVDWVSGACVVIRREVIDQIGLLDECYFLYYEETDFLLRGQRAGWSCWHVPDSRVVHLVGQSTGVHTRDQVPRRLPRYWFESRHRYFAVNYGRAYAVLADVLAALGTLVWRLKRAVQFKTIGDPPHFLADLWRNSALLRGNAPLRPRRTSL
jgi:N-acetylglucosaminyl-diphospho-decaprenol L-rhamnosyltransferase